MFAAKNAIAVMSFVRPRALRIVENLKLYWQQAAPVRGVESRLRDGEAGRGSIPQFLKWSQDVSGKALAAGFLRCTGG